MPQDKQINWATVETAFNKTWQKESATSKEKSTIYVQSWTGLAKPGAMPGMIASALEPTK